MFGFNCFKLQPKACYAFIVSLGFLVYSTILGQFCELINLAHKGRSLRVFIFKSINTIVVEFIQLV
jgi:hypothetical protein